MICCLLAGRDESGPPELMPIALGGAMKWILLLRDAWRDIIAVGSLVITVVGFGLSLYQLRKTKSAALAARDAANRAIEESRGSFRRHVLACAVRFLAETRLHANAGNWEKTASRLGDLADQLSQLSDADQNWHGLLIELREWEVKIVSRPMTEPMKRKWSMLMQRLQQKVDSQHGPFKDPIG